VISAFKTTANGACSAGPSPVHDRHRQIPRAFRRDGEASESGEPLCNAAHCFNRPGDFTRTRLQKILIYNDLGEKGRRQSCSTAGRMTARPTPPLYPSPFVYRMAPKPIIACIREEVFRHATWR